MKRRLAAAWARVEKRAGRRLRLTAVRLYAAWYDAWVGVYVDTGKDRVYAGYLPMLGVRVDYDIARICCDPKCHELCDVVGFLPDDVAGDPYCGFHALRSGFCRSCGRFAAGEEDFEFTNGGLCDNCFALEQRWTEEYDDDGDWGD